MNNVSTPAPEWMVRLDEAGGTWGLLSRAPPGQGHHGPRTGSRAERKLRAVKFFFDLASIAQLLSSLYSYFV